MVWCGSKKEYQKDMCSNEIGLHAQNMITIMDSTVNIIGWDRYDHLMYTGIFSSIMNNMFT